MYNLLGRVMRCREAPKKKRIEDQPVVGRISIKSNYTDLANNLRRFGLLTCHGEYRCRFIAARNLCTSISLLTY